MPNLLASDHEMSGDVPTTDHDGAEYEWERKFLVEDASILRLSVGERIEQAYLWAEEGYAIRVRVISSNESDDVESMHANITMKGPRQGASRLEVESQIPHDDAKRLLEIAPARISKTRYSIISEGNVWEVDVFHGGNEGLMVAEFEGSRTSVQNIQKPWWCSREITLDARYQNENLAIRPWPDFSAITDRTG